MVINDLNIDRPRRPFGPLEAYPPLVIDTNAILTLPGSFEGFEAVAGQIQVEKRCSRLQLVKLHFRFPLESGESLDPVACGELPGLLVFKADNHVLF